MAEVKLTVVGEDQTEPVRRGLGLTEKALGLVKAAAVAVGISFSAMMVVDYAKDAALLTARYNTLGVTMQVVGNNAGYTGEQMRGFQATLQATGIAMVEARQNLTSMAQAHIDLSKSAALARIAQDAAVIGGINSSEAFSRMVYGIQSAQVEVLRTIGLNVNFEDSYKKLGKQLGKNAEDLTEMEKVQARTNAVMEKGKDIAGAYEAAMGTAGKQISSMKRYMDDLKVKVGEVFQDALTVAVGWATDGLKGLNKEAEDLAKKNQIDQWGRSTLMAMAFVADGVQGIIISVKTLTESLIWSGKTLYGWAGIASSALSGDFANVGAWWDWMNKNTAEYSASMEKTFGNVKSFQDQARGYLEVKDAASKNMDALKAEEQARIKASAARQADAEKKAKQEAGEKRFIEDLKNNITGIKDYASAMKDLGKERLALANDQYQEKLKIEIDRYKDGKAGLEEMIKPLRVYNTQVNAVYNERLVNERAALDKIVGLYSEFKSKISITANVKEVRQHGVEILKEVKGQAEQIIAVESERYKTLLTGEKAYATEILKLIKAKEDEIKALQSRFEDANKAFEESKRLALGDYSGGFKYLDPNLDAYDKRRALEDKLRSDEAAALAIEDPARKKAKLEEVSVGWSKLTGAVEVTSSAMKKFFVDDGTFSGRTEERLVSTTETLVSMADSYNKAQEEQKRIQQEILGLAKDEQKGLEALHAAAIADIALYTKKIVELDDLLKSLTRDVTINLKVNGMEQLDRISGIVGAAVKSPFSSSPAAAPQINSGGFPSGGDPSQYYQVGDSFYWGDGSYGGPAYERGTDRVNKTGLALVHENEKITPAGQNSSAPMVVSFGDIIIQGGATPAATARELARSIDRELRNLSERRLAA